MSKNQRAHVLSALADSSSSDRFLSLLVYDLPVTTFI